MNKVILMGRLTKDPDLRFVAGTGNAVVKLTIAINRRKKDDGVDFINCIAFGKAGETIAQYFIKGKQIAIIGNIITGSYDAKDRSKRYTTDVIIETFEFINGDKKDSNSSTSPQAFDSTNNKFNDMMPVDDGDIPF